MNAAAKSSFPAREIFPQPLRFVLVVPSPQAPFLGHLSAASFLGGVCTNLDRRLRVGSPQSSSPSPFLGSAGGRSSRRLLSPTRSGSSPTFVRIVNLCGAEAAESLGPSRGDTSSSDHHGCRTNAPPSTGQTAPVT
jgi:hypothetical protein